MKHYQQNQRKLHISVVCADQNCSMRLSHDIRDSYKEQLEGMKEKAELEKAAIEYIINDIGKEVAI